MDTISPSNDPPSAPSKAWRGLTGGLLLMVASGGLFYRLWQTAAPAPVAVAPDFAAAEHEELTKKLGKFFDEDARPLLLKTRGQDLAAIATVLNSLDDTFKRYEQGVPKFASDLTGWGTRFKIMYRKGVETAEGKEQHTWTQQLIQDKFSQHVMSDASLEQDLLAIMKQFNFDLEANRNQMLASLQTKLVAADLPVKVKSLQLAEFKTEFGQKLQSLLKAMPQQSLGVGLGSITSGIVAEEAVRQIVRTIIAEMTVRIASSAAVAGGAASSAAAAGATGGSAIAPGVGTVLGLAGGFLVGALVDWWMTDSFQEKIVQQCHGFLDTTKASLLEGEGGLKKILTAQIEQAASAYEKATQDTLRL